MRLGQLGLERASLNSGRIQVRMVQQIRMLHYVGDPFRRTTETEITVAAKLLSTMLPSVGSDSVGRKVGNDDTKQGARRGQSRMISRWARFLKIRTREGLGDLDYHRENRSLPLTLFWPRRASTRFVLPSPILAFIAA